MGRRRNTAKTGDKSLYSNRQRQEQDVDIPPIDLGFQSEADSSKGSADSEQVRHVLDLGAGEQSSDDESLRGPHVVYHGVANPQDDEATPMALRQRRPDLYSSSDDDDDEDDPIHEELHGEEATNWGNKKASYYSADTADIEIGQDEEDAFVEEEAARDVRDTRFEEMNDDDFAPPFLDAGISDLARKRSAAQTSSFDSLHTSTLPNSAKRQLMSKHYPHVMSMISYFSQTVKELELSTRVAVGALGQVQNDVEGLRRTAQGDQYLLTKSLLQGSIALSTVMYLLLMSEYETDKTEARPDGVGRFHAHPAIGLLKKMERALASSRFAEVDEQVGVLVKATSMVIPLVAKQTILAPVAGVPLVARRNESLSEVMKNEAIPYELQNVVNSDRGATNIIIDDAQFSLRSREVMAATKPKAARKFCDCLADYGDTAEETRAAGRQGFASTLNSIEQRVSHSKQNKRPNVDRGFDVELETEPGYELSDGWDGGSMTDERKENPISLGRKHESSSDPGSPSFYSAIDNAARQKKEAKNEMYMVEPKYPVLEYEVSGERPVSKRIIKNRGLVAHKARINRNPRVKKRMQYRKALIRRKGTVRGIRVDEGHKYGGEGTGIKTRISRSRKL